MMNECLFCAEGMSKTNTFMESELFRARWDQIPLRPGHAEVVPKRHIQFFSQLNDSEMTEMLFFVAQVVEHIKNIRSLPHEYKKLLEQSTDYTRPYLLNALKSSKLISTPPDAFNHGVNDGFHAGQTIRHLHYHIIPRWSGDVDNPRGSIRNMLGEDAYSGGI